MEVRSLGNVKGKEDRHNNSDGNMYSGNSFCPCG